MADVVLEHVYTKAGLVLLSWGARGCLVGRKLVYFGEEGCRKEVFECEAVDTCRLRRGSAVNDVGIVKMGGKAGAPQATTTPGATGASFPPATSAPAPTKAKDRQVEVESVGTVEMASLLCVRVVESDLHSPMHASLAFRLAQMQLYDHTTNTLRQTHPSLPHH